MPTRLFVIDLMCSSNPFLLVTTGLISCCFSDSSFCKITSLTPASMIFLVYPIYLYILNVYLQCFAPTRTHATVNRYSCTRCGGFSYGRFTNQHNLFSSLQLVTFHFCSWTISAYFGRFGRLQTILKCFNQLFYSPLASIASFLHDDSLEELLQPSACLVACTKRSIALS